MRAEPTRSFAVWAHMPGSQCRGWLCKDSALRLRAATVSSLGWLGRRFRRETYWTEERFRGCTLAALSCARLGLAVGAVGGLCVVVALPDSYPADGAGRVGVRVGIGVGAREAPLFLGGQIARVEGAVSALLTLCERGETVSTACATRFAANGIYVWVCDRCGARQTAFVHGVACVVIQATCGARCCTLRKGRRAGSACTESIVQVVSTQTC
eukprot:3605525-Rhodomonas_salina.2